MPELAERESIRPKGSRKDRPCDHCRRLKHSCRISVRGEPCGNCVRGKRECTFTGPSVQRHLTTPSGREDSWAEVSLAGGSLRPQSLHDAICEIEGVDDAGDQDSYYNDLDQDLQDEEESHCLGSGFFTRDQLRDVESDPSYRQVAHPTRPVYFLRNPSRVYGYANADYEAQKAYNAMMAIILQHGPLLPTRMTELLTESILPAFPIMNAVRLEAACKGWQGGGSFPFAIMVGIFAFVAPSIPVLRPVCKELWGYVVQLLDNEYRRPRLYTLQLALFDIAGRPVLNPGGNHIAIGRANGLAQLLGLHRDSSMWKLPKWERSLRKRIWWTLYVQDRWNALIYDRPIQVVAGTQDVRPVSSLDDDWGGHNSQSSLDVFELTCLLATTIDRLLPIIQVSLQGVSSSQALLQITQDVDRIDSAARRLAPKSPGLASLVLSLLGLSTLICRMAAAPDPRDQSHLGGAKAAKAAAPVTANLGRMADVISQLTRAEIEGYWPIWTSHIITMSVTAGLHLAMRTNSAESDSSCSISNVFPAICRLVDSLQSSHYPGVSDSAGSSIPNGASDDYWEVADTALKRLAGIITVLPPIAGSEQLRTKFAQAQGISPLAETGPALIPSEWYNWIDWPQLGFDDPGQGSMDPFFASLPPAA